VDFLAADSKGLQEFAVDILKIAQNVEGE